MIFYRHDGLTIRLRASSFLTKSLRTSMCSISPFVCGEGFDTVGIHVQSWDLSPQILGACDRIPSAGPRGERNRN